MSDSAESQLYDAAENGRASEVSSLLGDHPEINVNWANPDYSQWTPLHIACRYGHAEVVKLLLAHPDINVNWKSSNGRTPLSFGCWNGQVSVVRLLLKDPRVDVNLDDNRGRTPLWWASRFGKHEVIEWLIASDRDIGDVENKKGRRWDGKDYTALEIAREQKKTDVVALLERFMVKPTQTRAEVQKDLGITGTHSFIHFFTLFSFGQSIFLCFVPF